MNELATILHWYVLWIELFECRMWDGFAGLTRASLLKECGAVQQAVKHPVHVGSNMPHSSVCCTLVLLESMHV
jgi:hypothetical protein